MDEKQLHRVFAQIKPAPEQEEAMLASLLTEKRRVTPMKTMKKTVALATAAALLLLACAFTVMTDLDQRLLEHLGVKPADVELLSPVARPVDVEVTDSGATLKVQQVLIDRNIIAFQADFTVSDEMAQRMQAIAAENPNANAHYSFSNPDYKNDRPYFIAQDGTKLPWSVSWGGWGNLDDDDPADNHIAISYYIPLNDENLDEDLGNVQALWFPAIDFVIDHTHEQCGKGVVAGDWSFELPLDGMTDPGWEMGLNEGYDHDLLDLTLGELYLSPMTLSFDIRLNGEVPWEEPIYVWLEDEEYEAWDWLFSELGYGVVTLTSPEGRTVSMQITDSNYTGENSQQFTYLLAEIIDPAEFQGGTLTIEDQTYSLDGLTPVSP